MRAWLFVTRSPEYNADYRLLVVKFNDISLDTCSKMQHRRNDKAQDLLQEHQS